VVAPYWKSYYEPAELALVLRLAVGVYGTLVAVRWWWRRWVRVSGCGDNQ
jgi:hypothetical protein